MSKSFFYLSILCFVFIVFSTFFISKQSLFQRKVYAENSATWERGAALSSFPRLVGKQSFPIISAQAALATDLGSGATLYEKNPDAIVLPASTTKIVTAMVALDYYPLDQILVVPELKVYGQKMRLIPGERMNVRNLLYGLLVFSANDAAEVLAQNYPGGRKSFILSMNLKAEELGLENTFFNNPTGLEAENHFTTARDLVRVSEIAMRNTFFRKVVGTKEIVVTDSDGQIVHKLVNINQLIGEVDGVLGIKTGWTENARENLVTFIERDGKRVIIAVLGSQDRFGETRELIEWIFSNYKWSEPTGIFTD